METVCIEPYFNTSSHGELMGLGFRTSQGMASSENVLEWVQKDKRRMLHAVYRVGDLDRTIKIGWSVDLYYLSEIWLNQGEKFKKLDGLLACGMKLLRKKDVPDYKYTIAMMGYADEHETTVLELTYNYGVTEYTKGNAYAQIAISTEDVYKSAEVVDIMTKELGGKITRQPGPIPGLSTKITAFLDPDGWKTVLVDHIDFLKELGKA
ncbi:Lactoylglutathione lyase [Carex littledalei]|uniref:Lactoylglutathione lyase n=1 Tax=Carex littledalei TaxID=544730 RepID=A0A833VGV9_9POAL|nr:Lactoylglutathione lyase [Carex littledalei]